MPRPYDTPLPTFLVIICAFVLSGCGATSRSTEMLRPADPTDPIFIEVFDFRGNVLVTEDPGIDQIQVDRQYHARDKLVRVDRNIDLYGDLNQSLDRIDYRASLGQWSGGRLVCSIVVETAHQFPDEQRVDLEIRVPKIAGVNIQTRDGWIDLRNVAGPIQASTENADIIVTTEHPLTAPVNLVTAHGHIDLRIPATSAGVIDVEAQNGYAMIDGGPAGVRVERIGNERASGSLHAGDSRMTLRTTGGNARVIVRDAPGQLSPIERVAVPVGRP